MDHFRGTREGLGADGNGAWNDRAEPVKASYRQVLRGVDQRSGSAQRGSDSV